MKVVILQNHDLKKLEKAINSEVGTRTDPSEARVTITPVITTTFNYPHNNSQQHEITFVATIEMDGWFTDEQAKERWGE